MDRIYCTLAELYEDLGLPGVKSEAGLMRHVKAASQFIDQTLGEFIPRTETLKFCGPSTAYASGSWRELQVPALLSIASLTNDGAALVEGTDFVLTPHGRHWPNGPYSALLIPETSSAGGWSTQTEGVVITGNWGMYDQRRDLDALVTTADATSTGLAVTDGSKVSAGMVLLVGSEQMLVEATGVATDSTADLAEALDDSESEVTVTDGAVFHAGEVIKVGFEQMKVEDVSGDDLSVSRGWNESKRAAHLSGSSVYVQRTFTVKRGANGTTAAAHAAEAVYQCEPPADVNYLCRQIAALMVKKAQTGFVGRSGNDDLGTGYWVNEFPKNQIEAVKSNYFWGGR